MFSSEDPQPLNQAQVSRVPVAIIQCGVQPLGPLEAAELRIIVLRLTKVALGPRDKNNVRTQFEFNRRKISLTGRGQMD